MALETKSGGPSARAYLAALSARDLSARELAERTLARIDAVNPALNAVVLRDDEAVLAAAEVADVRRAVHDPDRDRPLPPLLGLPLTIKDVLDVAGWRTTSGSLARTHHRADGDATVVARLRAAGAIPLLKTNAPELSSSYETDNIIFGRTNHPLDPTRTPGGSSGGEAALLAAGASIAGIGTDCGGSIRVPSHYCGTTGIRPTAGRTPTTGLWPPDRAGGNLDFTCAGPMARHVDDLALLLPVMAGADGVDPYAVDVPLQYVQQHDGRPLRVAFYDDHPRAPNTTPETRAAVRHAARLLAGQGHEVEEIAPPEADGDHSATELFFGALGADGGAALRAAVAPAGGRHHPQFAALLGDPDAPPPSAAAFFATLRAVHAYRARVRALASRHDVLLSPVVSGPAPRHGEPPAGIPADRYLRYEAFEYCHIYAIAGLPAASVPVATTPGGLPLGVQVAAAPFREDLVLAAAVQLEAAAGR